jgi:hypothetical protein
MVDLARTWSAQGCGPKVLSKDMLISAEQSMAET